jgi:hypothetical protein
MQVGMQDFRFVEHSSELSKPELIRDISKIFDFLDSDTLSAFNKKLFLEIKSHF